MQLKFDRRSGIGVTPVESGISSPPATYKESPTNAAQALAIVMDESYESGLRAVDVARAPPGCPWPQRQPAISGMSSPADGKENVLRGGSWKSSADASRSRYRLGENPGFSDACLARDAIGFRCVRQAPR